MLLIQLTLKEEYPYKIKKKKTPERVNKKMVQEINSYTKRVSGQIRLKFY